MLESRDRDSPIRDPLNSRQARSTDPERECPASLDSSNMSKSKSGSVRLVNRPGRIPLFSNVNEFKNVVKFNIAGVVKINNVVRFNLGVTSLWRRTCGPINCFNDKSNLTLLKIYQK